MLTYRSWSLEERYGVVVLLPGLSCHSGTYGNIVNKLLLGGYTVYTFDYRGHGTSQVTFSHVNVWHQHNLFHVITGSSWKSGKLEIFD